MNRAARYASAHGVFMFTSMSVHEIVYGLELKGASIQLMKTVTWLGRNEQVVPMPDDYLQSAVLRADARKQGSILPLSDCLIAAVAIRLGLPLATGNTKDFQAIQRTGARLVIDNWREPR
jgi:predicted nucleic acid-binding protein